MAVSSWLMCLKYTQPIGNLFIRFWMIYYENKQIGQFSLVRVRVLLDIFDRPAQGYHDYRVK